MSVACNILFYFFLGWNGGKTLFFFSALLFPYFLKCDAAIAWRPRQSRTAGATGSIHTYIYSERNTYIYIYIYAIISWCMCWLLFELGIRIYAVHTHTHTQSGGMGFSAPFMYVRPRESSWPPLLQVLSSSLVGDLTTDTRLNCCRADLIDSTAGRMKKKRKKKKNTLKMRAREMCLCVCVCIKGEEEEEDFYF